jgi:membrane-associated phospholipid phosphatase
VMPKLMLLVALLFLNCRSLAATSGTTLGNSFGEELAAPLSRPAVYSLAGGAVVTGLLVVFHAQLEDHAQASLVAHRPLGRWSEIGDVAGQLVPNAAYAIGMETFSLLAHEKESGRLALLMVKATAYSSGVTEILKFTVREPRPNNGHIRTSFPSGHAASAFSFAAVVGEEHEWYYAVPAYALAGFVGLSRVNDGQHRIHDVIAGAAIGMSYGIGLAIRHSKPDATGSKTALFDIVTVQPTPNLDGAVGVISKAF